MSSRARRSCSSAVMLPDAGLDITGPIAGAGLDLLMPELAAIAFPQMIVPPEPTQARSKQAFEHLLQVGEQLLAENRFDEIGVADLAKLAETSVGTFYRLLKDKDTLSRLLLQRFFSDMAALEDELVRIALHYLR